MSADAQPFPIVEVFGYATDASSPEAKRAFTKRWCRFADNGCEKFRQYGYGYCSVTYAAQDDKGTRNTYAVCDHRLDGEPVRAAIADHFGARGDVKVVPEVVLTRPRRSFDYVAFTLQGGQIDDAVAIETQAIDIRGGGVGPAWQAWLDGRPDQWREYFTKEAARKGRKDNVAYGVNMANIFKRLGLQIVVKGSELRQMRMPLYVVMQDRPFQYLRKRIQFAETKSRDWDITFMTFDYTGKLRADGSFEFVGRQTVRTSLASYVEALTSADPKAGADARRRFLEQVQRKAGL